MREDNVPKNMHDAKIITLYKNKGARSNCNNHKGISAWYCWKIFCMCSRSSPTEIGRKSISWVAIWIWISKLIFCVRQLQEKWKEQNVSLYIAFIDLNKAFNLVSREGLFAILLNIGCLPSLFNIVKSFHTNMKGNVQYDGNACESFTIKNGLKHGCVFAPNLFGFFFFMLLKCVFCSSTLKFKLHTRFDRCLFNSAHLIFEIKGKTDHRTRSALCWSCCTLRWLQKLWKCFILNTLLYKLELRTHEDI